MMRRYKRYTDSDGEVYVIVPFHGSSNARSSDDALRRSCEVETGDKPEIYGVIWRVPMATRIFPTAEAA